MSEAGFRVSSFVRCSVIFPSSRARHSWVCSQAATGLPSEASRVSLRCQHSIRPVVLCGVQCLTREGGIEWKGAACSGFSRQSTWGAACLLPVMGRDQGHSFAAGEESDSTCKSRDRARTGRLGSPGLRLGAVAGRDRVKLVCVSHARLCPCARIVRCVCTCMRGHSCSCVGCMCAHESCGVRACVSPSARSGCLSPSLLVSVSLTSTPDPDPGVRRSVVSTSSGQQPSWVLTPGPSSLETPASLQA